MLFGKTKSEMTVNRIVISEQTTKEREDTYEEIRMMIRMASDATLTVNMTKAGANAINEQPANSIIVIFNSD